MLYCMFPSDVSYSHLDNIVVCSVVYIQCSHLPGFTAIEVHYLNSKNVTEAVSNFLLNDVVLYGNLRLASDQAFNRLIAKSHALFCLTENENLLMLHRSKGNLKTCVVLNARMAILVRITAYGSCTQFWCRLFWQQLYTYVALLCNAASSVYASFIHLYYCQV